MPYYINPYDGSLAYDAQLPAGAIQTGDPNAAGAKVAPADSWYALPGNGGKVYVRAGVPIPSAGSGSTIQYATAYKATDDSGTMPLDQSGGAIHTPGAKTAADWKLPGIGQFSNQAWTGPSDWRGVPFAQMDTQGRPLSNYNNLVDQYQASRQPLQTGQPFARWAFGNGLLGNAAGGNGNGLLDGATTQQPRVTTDSASAGGYFANPQQQPVGQGSTVQQPATNTGTNTSGFGPSPSGQGGAGYGPGSYWDTLSAQNPTAWEMAYGKPSDYTWIGGMPYYANPSNGGQLSLLNYWGSGKQPGT